jgi:hypothetical protein
MQPVYDAGIGVYPIRGNHDIGSPAGTTAWNTVFSGAYAVPQNGPAGEVGLTYSAAHKNVFVLALDEYTNSMRVNQTWVDAQLAANTRPHVFAFGHVPAFKVDHADCLDDYAAQRDAFWASLKNAGCRVYACGHDHFYDHAVVDDLDGDPDNNIHQYLVGTAGAPLRGWSPPYNGANSGMTVEQWHHRKQFGYVLAEVLDDVNVRMVWYERDLETFSYKPVLGSVDMDGSGVVNIGDLLWLAQRWLLDDCRTGNNFCDGADIDQLTTADLEDFSLLSQEWQKPWPLKIDIKVNSGSDDVEETVSNGSMYLDSTDLELIRDSSDQMVGIRFGSVAIPQNAQIANAYLQFTCDEINNINPCNLTVYAENADNAAAFSTSSYNVSSRSRTAGVAWNPPDWTVVSQAVGQRTPNLASIIETVVNRPGWQSGNAMVFVITGTGRRTAESYEGFADMAPVLHVETE